MNGKITVPLYTDGCVGSGNRVKYLEHVQARITMTASRRGEIQIFLTSPWGTRSRLLEKRVRDTSREGFNNWAFMTTHNWGEFANGTWILEIENGASSCKYIYMFSVFVTFFFLAIVFFVLFFVNVKNEIAHSGKVKKHNVGNFVFGECGLLLLS